MRNRVVSLRDVEEWTDGPLPEGATITVEAGQFVLVTAALEDRVDARYSTSVNADLIDAGNAAATNPDLFDGGSS